jgi:hypothetical protein
MQPTRVILSCDDNTDYITFWPVVSAHWKQIHKIQPTLLYIGTHAEKLDRTWGDIIPMRPLPNVPTSFQAQMARLLGPCLFPDEVCAVADIDLFLLKPGFFKQYGLDNIPKSCFVSLNRYPTKIPHLSMTYQVAKGSTFQDVFQCKGTIDDIRAKLTEYAARKIVPGEVKQAGTTIPWSRDEKILTRTLEDWQRKNPQQWKRIYTPGIWGIGAPWIVSRFDKCRLPSNLATLVELEPNHPLPAAWPLVKRIIGACNPTFVFPDIDKMYIGTPVSAQASRHPWKRKQGDSSPSFVPPSLRHPVANPPQFLQLRQRR